MTLSAPPLTPDQCHDARGLLGWNGVELAMAAHINPPALIRFEHHKGGLDREVLRRLREVLESEGIEFGDDGGVRRARPKLKAL